MTSSDVHEESFAPLLNLVSVAAQINPVFLPPFLFPLPSIADWARLPTNLIVSRFFIEHRTYV